MFATAFPPLSMSTHAFRMTSAARTSSALAAGTSSVSSLSRIRASSLSCPSNISRCIARSCTTRPRASRFRAVQICAANSRSENPDDRAMSARLVFPSAIISRGSFPHSLEGAGLGERVACPLCSNARFMLRNPDPEKHCPSIKGPKATFARAPASPADLSPCRTWL